MREYLKAFYSEWGSGVTGSLSAPLFLFSLLVDRSAPRIAAAALAIICLYVASYRVWRRERTRYEQEAAKNVAPRFVGSFSAAVLTQKPAYQDQKRTGAILSVDWDFVNASPMPAMLRFVRVTFQVCPPGDFRSIDHPLHSTTRWDLNNGAKGNANLIVHDVERIRIPTSSITVALIDFQNRSYPLERRKQQDSFIEAR